MGIFGTIWHKRQTPGAARGKSWDPAANTRLAPAAYTQSMCGGKQEVLNILDAKFLLGLGVAVRRREIINVVYNASNNNWSTKTLV